MSASPLHPSQKLRNTPLWLCAMAIAMGHGIGQSAELATPPPGQGIRVAGSQRPEVSEPIGKGVVITPPPARHEIEAGDIGVPDEKEVAEIVTSRLPIPASGSVRLEQMGDIGAEQPAKEARAKEVKKGSGRVGVVHDFFIVAVMGSLGGIIGGTLYFIATTGKLPFTPARNIPRRKGRAK